MKKYLLFALLVGFCFGNQRFNRIPPDALNLDQLDIRTNDFRNEEELLNFIDSTMETNFIPGLSISIAKGGSIVWNKHFGYTNINENILVDENTKFILSSASKTITATALMQLFQQNLFMLDDDVDNYLPFDISHPVYPEIPITFKMLLSHTSGIKDNWSFMPFYDGDSPLELSYYLSQYFSPLGEFYDNNLNFTDYAPGTGFSYSNIGAALVGLLVEEISNQSFNEYCIENIFEPLGMSDAYWFLSEIENLNKVASPHEFADGSTDSLIVLENYGYSDYPAGQLRTTSYNLAKFMNLFINDGLHDGVEILSQETIELMKTIHYPDIAYDQGLIWYYKTLNERTLFGHGGSDKGSLTEMFISSSDDIGVVLLSNSRNHEGMAQIENAVFNYAVDTDFTISLDYECIAEDGTEGIELWGECYSIDNTTHLGFPISIPDTASVIPQEIFSLTNLRLVSLNYSNISGPIPSEISNLTKLVTLNLSNNQISGSIPTEIGNLDSLFSLNLSSNQLTGEIPLELLSLTNLEGGVRGAMLGTVFEHGLNLSNNMLSGQIPENIGNLSKLKSIDLSSNQLSGSLPIQLYSLQDLLSLDLSDNALSGEIVAEIGNLISLEGVVTTAHNSSTSYSALDISNNHFIGTLPQSICDLPIEWDNASSSDLLYDFGGNQFCPEYPSCIESSAGTQDTSNCAPLSSLIEGRWLAPLIVGAQANTMYEFINDLRYTYYCSSDTNGCDSTYWNSLDLNDAIPNPNPYTFINDTLTVDIFFGNTWQRFATFECDGSVVSLIDPTSSEWKWHRVGLDTSACENQELGIPNITNTPEKFKLTQNYPNPFNPTTSISYDLPKSSFVYLTIYDLTGKTVKTLVNSLQYAGYKTVQWNSTNQNNAPVPAGVYFYEVRAGNLSQTKKMLLLK
ncbi:serine hydrolase [bacterium]|nr:serine hydrolase [bacterium]